MAGALAGESSDRIRVLFVAPALRMGGMERHAVISLPALDRGRFEVEAVCLEEPGALFAELVAAGVPAVSYGGHGSKAKMALAFVRLLRRAHDFQPHIIMTSLFNADAFGRVIAQLCRVPVTVSWRHNCGHFNHWYGHRDWLAERALGRFTTRYFAVAFGQLPYLVSDRRLDPEKIRLIHNSVPIIAPLEAPRRVALARSVGISPGDRVVGMVAMLRPEKDHLTMLAAFQAVLGEEPRAKLLLVGDGPQRPRLAAQAEALGMGERVVFLGERHDARELVQLFDVAALSSSTVETFSFAVLEAMAASKPVVATAVGGLPELVDNGVTGYIVTPKAPKALASRIACLLRDPERAARMGEAGRRRLEERFPFSHMASQIEAELEEALAERRPRRSEVKDPGAGRSDQPTEAVAGVEAPLAAARGDSELRRAQQQRQPITGR